MNNFFLKIKNIFKLNYNKTNTTSTTTTSITTTNNNNDGSEEIVKDFNIKRFNRIVFIDLALLLMLFIMIPIVLFVIYNLTKTINIAKILNDYYKGNVSQSFKHFDNNIAETTLPFNLNTENYSDKEAAPLTDHLNADTDDGRKINRLRSMRKYLLSNTNAVCNDGSPAGYYLRKSSSKSKKWIIVLEGGNFCNNDETCKYRMLNSGDLMSSLNWTNFRNGSGILSNKRSENKHWWNANAVVIPYCSSDLWLGNKECKTNCKKSFSFMGRQILDGVLDDLLKKHRMSVARQIVLTGVSAGGIGVIMNIDELSESLKTKAPNAQFKGIIDSSWLLDLPCGNHQDQFNCSISETFFQTIKYWDANIPLKYLAPFEKPWFSLLPHKIYSLIKTPLFVIQSLFDETQLVEQHSVLAGQTQRPILRLTRTIRLLKARMLKTFEAIQSAFVPSCLTHMILLNRRWSEINIDNKYLVDVLNCWINKSPNSQACTSRVIDTCNWPNCNKACLNPTNPLNGNEINPLELLSFYSLIKTSDLETHLNVKNDSYDEIMSRLMRDRKTG